MTAPAAPAAVCQNCGSNFTIASTPRTFDRETSEWKDGAGETSPRPAATPPLQVPRPQEGGA